jgi:hypothetical protein
VDRPCLPKWGGLDLHQGLYTHAESINIAATNSTVYLDAQGDPDAVFVFNAGSTLTTSSESEIVLLDGARKEHVLWVLGTALTMGADSLLVGNVLAGSAITMGTNGSIIGRAIAQIAVTCGTACTIEANGRHSASPSSPPTSQPTSGPTSGFTSGPTSTGPSSGSRSCPLLFCLFVLDTQVLALRVALHGVRRVLRKETHVTSSVSKVIVMV